MWESQAWWCTLLTSAGGGGAGDPPQLRAIVGYTGQQGQGQQSELLCETTKQARDSKTVPKFCSNNVLNILQSKNGVPKRSFRGFVVSESGPDSHMTHFIEHITWGSKT